MMTRISALLLEVATLGCLRVHLATSFEGLTGHELGSVRQMKDRVGCGYTFYTKDVQAYLIPWICLPRGTCDKKWDHILNSTHQQSLYSNIRTGHVDGFCSQRWFNENSTDCCFMGDIDLFDEFELKDWPKISYLVNETYWNSTMRAINEMYEEDSTPGHHWMFREYEVCAMYPVGRKKTSHLYTPHFCVEENVCDSNSTYNIPPPQGRAQLRIPFCNNNDFEITQDRRRQKLVCCHPNAISDPKTNADATWALRAFPTYTTYVTGLRASIQCERYSKEVCMGGSDFCPFRSLYKGWDRALPMAAYHLESACWTLYPASATLGLMRERYLNEVRVYVCLFLPFGSNRAALDTVRERYLNKAMVGIRKPRAQIFFCQGTIVSRQYILSAQQCATYNYAKANIVLMGDFETYNTKELFSSELFSYITQHIRMPLKLREDAGFVHDTSHEEIILFKLWKPMMFTPYLRPACIVGETFYPEVPKWLGKDLAYFTGYGSKYPDEGYSDTSKPLILETLPWNITKCKGYYADGSESARDDADNGEMCATGPSAKTQEDYGLPALPERYGDPWGPCKFDLGAPLTILQTVPYCQLSVIGVLSREPYHCNNLRPNLFRKVSPNIMWIERVIYRDDFDIFDFDLSWPSCDRNNWQFINMTYVREENNAFGNK